MTSPSPAPLTEAEQAAAEALDTAEFDSELTLINEGSREAVARAVVAAVYDLIATEARYSAADRLSALAPEQATPDAKDAFWRAAAIVRSNPLSRPTSEETPDAR